MGAALNDIGPAMGASPAGSTGVQADPGRIAGAVIMARTAEFFDFFVYGIASVLVFPKLFFPDSDPVTATMQSFAVFSLAFVARPVGSLIFMAIDRQYGRAAKLIVALFLLCGSTMAISFLPGYATLGVLAPLLLALFRIGQGLGLGGAWDGLVSLLALNAPPERRSWYAMIPQLGAALGFMLASGLFIVFSHTLNSAEFLAWGWRFPFFVALALNVVALFSRLRLIVTPEFEELYEERELQPMPYLETLRVHGRTILVGAFVPLASYAMFHIVTVFPLGWIALNTRQNPAQFLEAQFFGAVLAAGTMVLSGIIADRIGRRSQLGIGAALIAAFSFFTAPLLGSGENGSFTFVLIGFALLGLSFGQASGALASRFSAGYRYTGAAITTDIAWLIGAGFAPIVALGLSTRFGLMFAGFYLLSGALCTLAALAVAKRLETDRG